MTQLANRQIEEMLKDVQTDLAKTFFEKKRRERMRPDLSRQDRIKQDIPLDEIQRLLPPTPPFRPLVEK